MYCFQLLLNNKPQVRLWIVKHRQKPDIKVRRKIYYNVQFKRFLEASIPYINKTCFLPTQLFSTNLQLKGVTNKHLPPPQVWILTCAWSGLGGSRSRRPSYLARCFDPTGLGCAHLSKSELTHRVCVCQWVQTLKPRPSKSTFTALWLQSSCSNKRTWAIKQNKKRKREKGGKVQLTKENLWRKRKTKLDAKLHICTSLNKDIFNNIKWTREQVLTVLANKTFYTKACILLSKRISSWTSS